VNRRTLRALTGVAVTAVALSTLQIPAQAAKAQGFKAQGFKAEGFKAQAQPAEAPAQHDPDGSQARKPDDHPHRLGEKERALREEATRQLIKGTAKIETKGGGRVINLGKGKFVQYAVEREESIFTVLSEFGTEVEAKTGGTAGPCTTRSRSRTASGTAAPRTTTPPTGLRTSTAPTSRT